jgi:glycosyltransferase involved in cell wall biosynthesis
VKLSLVYLGKRGGGALLAENAFRFGRESGLVNRIFVSSNNQLMHPYKDDFYLTRTPIVHSLGSLYKLPISLIVQICKSVHWAISTRADLIVFVMPSPFDIVTMSVIRMFNRKIIFICHETSAHEGENWPTENAISRRVKKSDLVVTLSQSESKKLANSPWVKNLKQLWHPVIDLPAPDCPPEVASLDLAKPVFLFIGRFKTYKGLQDLVAAWHGGLSGQLIIAGEGNFVGAVENNTLMINRWLTDGEISFLLNLSDVVVFPYISASQSGLIPIARFKGKTIIATMQPGFTEQLNGYLEKTIWVKGSGVKPLRNAIEEFIQGYANQAVLREISELDHSMVAFLREVKETWSYGKQGRRGNERD